MHCGPERDGWGGRRSRSGWRSRPQHDLWSGRDVSERRVRPDGVVVFYTLKEARIVIETWRNDRSTQRKVPTSVDDEAALTADIVALAIQYGRYGYRRITAMLRSAGWTVNLKRVERIWRREGLKVPARQPKRSRLWLNDGSCVRLRPERPNHVWSYDFMETRTHDGRKVRVMNVIDEFTRECLTIRVARKLKGTDVIDVPLRSIHPARCSRPCSIGQWSGVRRQGRPDLDHSCRRKDRLHHPRLSLGKRLRRELQL